MRGAIKSTLILTFSVTARLCLLSRSTTYFHVSVLRDPTTYIHVGVPKGEGTKGAPGR